MRHWYNDSDAYDRTYQKGTIGIYEYEIPADQVNAVNQLTRGEATGDLTAFRSTAYERDLS
jgi:hypothetical protein